MLHSPGSCTALASGADEHRRLAGADTKFAYHAHTDQHTFNTRHLVAGACSPFSSSATSYTTTTPNGRLSDTSANSSSVQCLRLKCFATFFVCTACLALLAGSLGTHKWIVSKPIRILKFATNASVQADLGAPVLRLSHHTSAEPQSSSLLSIMSLHPQPGGASNVFQVDDSSAEPLATPHGHHKFQGEIYFGLFSGLKLLNYGFGDRVSHISVIQTFLQHKQQLATDTDKLQNSPPAPAITTQSYPLVDFKLWLVTLLGVSAAIIFALVGAIFAIINFVMTPMSTLSGPVGLVLWNAAACVSCLIALIAWSIGFISRLKANVLTPAETQNGWTSDNRSQFGYSYYLVVLALVLHLANICTLSIVQLETWARNKASKRRIHTACEGVIMLY